jgi:hypothetical protein
MSLIEEKRAEWEAYHTALEAFEAGTPRPADIRLEFGNGSSVVYQPEEDAVKIYSRSGTRFSREDAQALTEALEQMFADTP